LRAGRHGRGLPGRPRPGLNGAQRVAERLNRRIVLARRPVGAPREEDFRLESAPVEAPGPGRMLVRSIYLSLDPYMRGRMNDGPSYAAPVALGQTMTGRVVGQVVASELDGFAGGDFVWLEGGWQEYAVSDGAGVRRLDPAQAPISTALGVLGMPGLTAYVGLYDLGEPKPGETVAVSAATGAVGSLAGQLARLRGCRAVGIAGGPEKCRYAVEELGYDACVDHRALGLAERLREACPKGIDVYFENVGGQVLEAVLPLLNNHARVPVCGLISGYNAAGPGEGPDHLPQFLRQVLFRRLSFRGFIVGDHVARRERFLDEVGGWLREGKVRWREDVVEGLENAPAAFRGLLEGRNFGKLLVRLSADPTR